MTDEPFRLTKTINGVTFVYDPVATTWEVSYGFPGSIGPYNPGDNWEKLGLTNTFLYQDQIDLSGLAADERTLFFGTQILQRADAYLSTVTMAPTGGALVKDVTIISDIPLTDPTHGGASPFNAQNAGFTNSGDEYTSVKLGIGRMWSQTTTAPLSLVNSDSWEFGSADPTASDTLYMYRYIAIEVPTPAPADAIQVPATRYVATGISTQESDLVYVNRLRRSYEQQR